MPTLKYPFDPSSFYFFLSKGDITVHELPWRNLKLRYLDNFLEVDGLICFSLWLCLSRKIEVWLCEPIKNCYFCFQPIRVFKFPLGTSKLKFGRPSLPSYFLSKGFSLDLRAYGINFLKQLVTRFTLFLKISWNVQPFNTYLWTTKFGARKMHLRPRTSGITKLIQQPACRCKFKIKSCLKDLFFFIWERWHPISIFLDFE